MIWIIPNSPLSKIFTQFTCRILLVISSISASQEIKSIRTSDSTSLTVSGLLSLPPQPDFWVRLLVLSFPTDASVPPHPGVASLHAGPWVPSREGSRFYSALIQSPWFLAKPQEMLKRGRCSCEWMRPARTYYYPIIVSAHLTHLPIRGLPVRDGEVWGLRCQVTVAWYSVTQGLLQSPCVE